MKFKPTEVILCPTQQCNLKCAHCTVKRAGSVLSLKTAKSFLKDCRKNGINRIGFSGGEPFLKPEFVAALVNDAAVSGMSFGRIMTNGVWFKGDKDLKYVLNKLFNAGFWGEICLSVDAFHKQPLNKLVLFIKTAVDIWKKPDTVSISYVHGLKDTETFGKLMLLAKKLGAKVYKSSGQITYIKSNDVFIRVSKISLSAVDKAYKLKNSWDGKWFKEDFCKGPGNVLFVSSNGDVAPCCGYASEHERLRIGNISRNSVKQLIKAAHQNSFVACVYSKGISSIRDNLIKKGYSFPGKTSNHCFLCWYLLTKMPKSSF